MSRPTRPFRPTLDGRLEPRLVLNGHMPAVRLTTNTYSNALSDIDLAVDRYAAAAGDGIIQSEFLALTKELKAASKTIPFGGKKLFPAMFQTIYNYASVGNHDAAALKSALNEELKHYIEINIQGGAIKYIQSGVHNTTDGDIPTSGHVPKGSKK